MLKKLLLFTAIVLCAGFPVTKTNAAVINLAPVKDNTLYEDVGGFTSNGSGDYLFAGRTPGANTRRAVMAFDIASSIPAGATINSANLTLNMSRCGPTCGTNVDFELRRLVADWGEGASDAEGQEGIPAQAEPDDATWLHTFYSDSYWATPGGDFSGVASGMRTVGNLGPYTWASTSLMVSDVQSWLDSPGGNFGWILMGGEDSTLSAKRFNSRENPSLATRPVLSIDYTPIPEPSTVLFVAAGALGVFRLRRR